MTALSDALRAAKSNDGISTRQIAQLTGDRVPEATISRYLGGQHPADPDDDVLEAFALALDLPIWRLRELARLDNEADPDAAYRRKWGRGESRNR